MTPTEALLLVAAAKFRPMTDEDRDMLAGTESDDARVAYTDDWVIIIDGSTIAFLPQLDLEVDFDQISFQLGEGIEI